MAKTVTSFCAGLCFLMASMFPSAPAQAAADCVTRAEYRGAWAAWQAEGLTRSGVRGRFGFDGVEVSHKDGALKHRYRACAGEPVLVVYRHFPRAPGPSSIWWVTRMWRAN